ncbi:TolC family protein [Chlorobium sp.]|uniref:TolC family protein n=1 Tax=Chlorobium sp. TaxID=1095 RepID=UPI0025B961B8|nr:TolC family protein [Chlorobium sp.]
MNRLLKLFCVSSLFLMLMPSHEVSGKDAPAQALTLEDAIMLALEKNPDIRVARNDERIARNKVHIGNAGLLPKIDFVAKAAYTENPGSAMPSAIETTTSSAQLQATYTLFNGFGNIYAFRKLKTAGEIGTLQARNAIEQIIIDVSKAYYDLANAQEQLRVAGDAVEISAERLRRAKLRSEYGQANTQEVLSAMVDANNDSVGWLQARLQKENAERMLNLLLGRSSDTPGSVVTAVTIQPVMGYDSLKAAAIRGSADYLIAKKTVEQSKFEMLQARSGFFPRIELQAGYGLSRTTEGIDVGLADTEPGVSAALTLSYNLFNGFQTAITVENARIALLNRNIYLQKASDLIDKKTSDLFHAYRNSREILRFKESNIESAELNFRRTKELYVLGQATGTTFREAQLNLVNARKSIAAARYESKMLELQIMRLAGTLLKQETEKIVSR